MIIICIIIYDYYMHVNDYLVGCVAQCLRHWSGRLSLPCAQSVVNRWPLFW